MVCIKISEKVIFAHGKHQLRKRIVDPLTSEPIFWTEWITKKKASECDEVVLAFRATCVDAHVQGICRYEVKQRKQRLFYVV